MIISHGFAEAKEREPFGSDISVPQSLAEAAEETEEGGKAAETGEQHESLASRGRWHCAGENKAKAAR